MTYKASTNTPISSAQVLIIGDPNLGPTAERIIRERFPQGHTYIWDVAGPKTAKTAREELLALGDHHLAITFYSDLVLKLPNIQQAGNFVINFHPAGPNCPGSGYDTIPLLDSHATTNKSITDPFLMFAPNP